MASKCRTSSDLISVRQSRAPTTISPCDRVLNARNFSGATFG